eukprot:3759748-Pyramimonas_sp.AAC.1
MLLCTTTTPTLCTTTTEFQRCTRQRCVVVYDNDSDVVYDDDRIPTLRTLYCDNVVCKNDSNVVYDNGRIPTLRTLYCNKFLRRELLPAPIRFGPSWCGLLIGVAF